jgi:diguanylate cyclase (GGDEF)-like protein
MTVSIGIATCGANALDYDAMFHIADQRLYQAKAAGRNCVVGERISSAKTPIQLAYIS